MVIFGFIIAFTSSALKSVHKRQSLYEAIKPVRGVTCSQGNLEQLIIIVGQMMYRKSLPMVAL